MSFNPQVLVDARIYWATADLTGYSNKIESSVAAPAEDSTTFGSGGWNQRVAGLFSGDITPEGLWQAGDLSMPDDTFWANLGVATVPVTVAPTSGAVNTLAYLTRVTETEYKAGAAKGTLLAWSAIGKSDQPVVRGTVMHPQGTPRTVTGVGTGIQLGAVTALQRMYCNLHVFSVAGTLSPSITVSLQSSVDNTFASPTTRITFNPSTTFDGQALNVLGATTDTWWRAAWTIGGSSPSFLFNVTAGVGPK